MQKYTKTEKSISNNSETTCDELHVIGDVGEDSIIETNHLQVDGTTHEDSTQFTREAHINIHEGTLRCHEASIKTLAGGEVHATKAKINSCEGGFIYAQEVYIQTLAKPVTIIASDSITINSIQCSHSKLQINYKDIPIINSKLDLIQEDLENLKLDAIESQKHNVSELPSINKQIDTLNAEYQKILNSYKTAIVTLNGTVQSDNKIIFTVDEKNDITYTTQEQKYKPFYLNIDNNKISLYPTKISITL